MEYDKINNLLRVVDTSAKHVLSEDNESEKLSEFVTREYVRVNSLSNSITKISQLDLKHPC